MAEAQVVAPVTHRMYDGSWALCSAPESCQLLFHFPGQTPAEMAAMPESLLYPLLEVMDPPSRIFAEGRSWRNRVGQATRGYDLPAIIRTDGLLGWYENGLSHRAGKRPAMVYPDGWREWWVHGVCVVVEPVAGGMCVIGDGSGGRRGIAAFPTIAFSNLVAAALYEHREGVRTRNLPVSFDDLPELDVTA